jgi:hypothetical protein
MSSVNFAKSVEDVYARSVFDVKGCCSVAAQGKAFTKSGFHPISKKQWQQTARERAKIHADLTWHDVYDQHGSEKPLLRTGECSQFAAEEFQRGIFHFVTQKKCMSRRVLPSVRALDAR